MTGQLQVSAALPTGYKNPLHLSSPRQYGRKKLLYNSSSVVFCLGTVQFDGWLSGVVQKMLCYPCYNPECVGVKNQNKRLFFHFKVY